MNNGKRGKSFVYSLALAIASFSLAPFFNAAILGLIGLFFWALALVISIPDIAETYNIPWMKAVVARMSLHQGRAEVGKVP